MGWVRQLLITHQRACYHAMLLCKDKRVVWTTQNSLEGPLRFDQTLQYLHLNSCCISGLLELIFNLTNAPEIGDTLQKQPGQKSC